MLPRPPPPAAGAGADRRREGHRCRAAWRTRRGARCARRARRLRRHLRGGWRTALRAGNPGLMRRLDALLPWATLVVMLAAQWLIFVGVPTEAQMGIVQRIFYFHVGTGVGRVRLLLRRRGRERGVSLEGLARGRSSRARLGGGRRPVLHARPRHGTDLGAADLGGVVDLGSAPHDDGHPVGDLRRLPDAARVRRRGRGGGALRGGARHRRRARHSGHPCLGAPAAAASIPPC